MLLSWIGKWELDRNITQRDQCLQIRAHAEFITLNKGILRYYEYGSFAINERSHQFFREYEYQQNKEEIQVYFVANNQRAHLFHRLKFLDQDCEFMLARAEHLCGHDQYKIVYKIFPQDMNKFEISYVVKGPAKDYVSNTLYNRILF